MTRQAFTAPLEASGRGGGHWIAVPFDAHEVFVQARPPVRRAASAARMLRDGVKHP
jgi:hypothetical protein